MKKVLFVFFVAAMAIATSCRNQAAEAPAEAPVEAAPAQKQHQLKHQLQLILQQLLQKQLLLSSNQKQTKNYTKDIV